MNPARLVSGRLVGATWFLLAACGAPAQEVGATPAAAPVADEPTSSVTANFGGVTCDAAKDAWSFEAAARKEPPSMAVFGNILENGNYLDACKVSPRTSVNICVAVVQGSVRGMTVQIDAGTQRQADCVVREVAHIKYPVGSMMSIAKTRFGGE